MEVFDLRHARGASGISLLEMAERTKIPRRLLEDLERGDFSRWPAGIYARAWVRSYAKEARLDPDTVLAAVESLLPLVKERPGAQSPSPRRASRIERIAIVSRRQAAAIVDALLLIAIETAVLVLCAVACRVSPSALLQDAPQAMGLLFGSIALYYFLLLGGIAGRTPGGQLMRLEGFTASRAVDPATAVRRAAVWALVEASICVDVLMSDLESRVRCDA
jgi:hypothetical protein